MWVQIVIMVVSALLQWATRPRQKPTQPDSNLTITPARDGQPILVIFGDCNIDPVTLWFGNPGSKEIKTRGNKK